MTEGKAERVSGAIVAVIFILGSATFFTNIGDYLFAGLVSSENLLINQQFVLAWADGFMVAGGFFVWIMVCAFLWVGLYCHFSSKK